MQLSELLQSYAERVAWRLPARLIFYRDLDSDIRQKAAFLLNQGLRPGDACVLRGWTAYDTFTLLLAGFWQKLLMFPLPDRLPDSMHRLMQEQIPSAICLEPSAVGNESCPGAIEIDALNLAIGIFTSGSTGTPKAILHSWSSLAHSAAATLAFYRFQIGDSWMLSLDLAHIGGLQIAMRCLLGGGVCWYLAEPKAVADALQTEAPQFISLVPTQLYRLLSDRSALEQLQKTRAIVLGGAPASPELMDKALAADLPVSVSYGSSETAAQCTALPPGTRPEKTGDVGWLLQGWEYEARDEILRLRGPALYRGYYQGRSFHAAADSAGWVTLPDRIQCEDGRLTLLGRADGIFQVAGENVAPIDIIQVLEPLRQSADFIALPWQDAEYGAVPVLVVRSPRKPEIDPILTLCRKHLTGVQRPRKIYWHRSDDINKPSRSYYESALHLGELSLLWSHDFGRV